MEMKTVAVWDSVKQEEQIFLEGETASRSLKNSFYVHQTRINTIRVSGLQGFFEVQGRGFLFSKEKGEPQLINVTGFSFFGQEVLAKFLEVVKEKSSLAA